MPRKRKYRQGDIIRTLAELEKELNAGRYVYLRDVPKHPSVIISMTLRTIQIFLRGDSLRYALLNKEN